MVVEITPGQVGRSTIETGKTSSGWRPGLRLGKVLIGVKVKLKSLVVRAYKVEDGVLSIGVDGNGGLLWEIIILSI